MSFTRFPCFTIFTCKSVNSINPIAILLLFIILAMLFVSCRLFDIYIKLNYLHIFKRLGLDLRQFLTG